MYINSMGCYVPSARIPNSYFEQLNGLEEGWIQPRTGILTRSRCAADEGVDTMGFDAVEDALKALPYDIKEVDLIVSASYCVYDSVATLGHKVQREYKIEGAKVVYASSACSSFINGLEIIEGYFAMGKATKALLICSEQNSYYANESDTKCGHLWGDAAVAFFISKDKQAPTDIRIVDVFTEGLGHVGKGPDGVRLRPKEEGITMPDGRDVFIHACRYMIYSLNKSLEHSGLAIDDVKHLICHQANKRIVAQVAHQLGKPMSFFLNNIEELGNTGSASAPLVLVQNRDKFGPGERAALMVFGGGYSCGCFVVEFPGAQE